VFPCTKTTSYQPLLSIFRGLYNAFDLRRQGWGLLMGLARPMLVHPKFQDELKKQQRPDGCPRWIHAGIWELQLPVDAQVVFFYMTTTIQARLFGSEWKWITALNLETIGECFRGDRGNHKQTPETLRRRASKAVKTLIERGVLEKYSRSELDARRGSFYVVLPIQQWKFPENLDGIKGSESDHLALEGSESDRSEDQGSLSDPSAITFYSLKGSESDPLTLKEQSLTERERSLSNYLIYKEGQDQKVIISNTEQPETLEETEFEAEFDYVPDPNEFPDDGIDVSDLMEPRQAAIEPPIPFCAETYDWNQYDGPGAGGSDPGFWSYALNKITAYANLNPGKIGDIPAYALGGLRKQGAKKYVEYLQAMGQIGITVSGSELHYSSPAPYLAAAKGSLDPTSDTAIVKHYWAELGLGWEDKRFLGWLDAAQNDFEVKLPPRTSLSLYHLSDAILSKLANDLRISFEGVRK
jgi:hypothetical protein